MTQPGLFGAALDGDVHGVGDLRGDVVKAECRDETDHAVGQFACHRNQIRSRQGRQLRESIQAAFESLQNAGVSHGVESPPVDASL